MIDYYPYLVPSFKLKSSLISDNIKSLTQLEPVIGIWNIYDESYQGNSMMRGKLSMSQMQSHTCYQYKLCCILW